MFCQVGQSLPPGTVIVVTSFMEANLWNMDRFTFFCELCALCGNFIVLCAFASLRDSLFYKGCLAAG